MVSFSPELIWPHKKKSLALSKTQGSHSSLTENSEIQEEKILPDPEMKVLQSFNISTTTYQLKWHNSMPGTGHQFPRFPAHNLVIIQTEDKTFSFFLLQWLIKHTHNILIFSSKANVLFYSNNMVMHFSLHSGHNSICQRATRFSYISDVISLRY